MPSPERLDLVDGIVEDFVDLIRPRREAKHKMDGTVFLKMVWRMARALEYRTIEDITLLPQVVALAQRFSEIANVAIAVNAARYKCDPMSGASANECAAVMGIKPPSASERRKNGERAILQRLQASNTIRIETLAKLRHQRNLTEELARVKAEKAARLSEARREGNAIQAAGKFAVTNLGEYRARHRKAA